ncbi:BEN domain-containing protein 7-like isoform X2 [Polyodon spathula]|uniref:BEN domain-containing protein 7-like isoform X2 n=1 Tax=Polyodon spathula TaxID=7913 RepID=UPI001B7E796F|nr:BEN domain-containing protein 7-like isoform X2 [Polyodon spathula]
MEFSERKRSRKSQSFKLVKEDFEAGYFDCNSSTDINGEANNTAAATGEIPIINNPAGPNCCLYNCKTTMQAILQELKAMRKLMQTQKGALSKQCAQHSPMPRKRNRKRKPTQKVAAPAAHSKKLCSQPGSTTEQNGKRDRPARERPGRTQPISASTIDTHVPEYCLIREMPSSEPEVQLAEGYEVYIPRTQLDSILVNYTCSGSLLFRKLVCAFFDDTTLANSLPNGKRKRGLNDNRKGLDQNIVGAIKVFTEKYCTANRIDKLPGPRDWVQILQDQIKLARRRLKQGTGGRSFEKSTDHVWVDADKDCTA